MKWGITCFFENRRDFALIEELAPQFPLEYVEFRGERPFFAPEDLSENDLRFFRQIIERSRLKVTVHATFFDINLSTLNSFLRQATLDCYRKYLDLAAELNAEVLVMHAGQLHKDASHIEELWELANRYLVENLQILGDYAARKNIVIGLENSPPNRNRLLVPNWQRQIEVLQRVDHPHVKALWDMAHSFLHGLDIQEYYDGIKDYLVEIHAHNNNGQEDQHRAMGRGAIPYETFFRRNNVPVPVIMEIRNLEEALESLHWIKQFA